MKILVTGAGGMFGAAFCGIARRAGHEVIAASRNGAAGDTYLDLTDSEQVRTAVISSGADCVVHGAAMTNVDRCEAEPEQAERINSFGSKIIAEAANECGSFLIAISSDFVFDGSTSVPYVESDIARPLNAYGRSKLLGERMMLDAHSWTCILRTSWLYGTLGTSFPSAVLARARRDGNVSIVNDQFGSPTWTDDLSTAVLAVIERQPVGVFHCANTGVVSRYNFAKTLLDRANVNCKVESITTSEYAQRVPGMAPRPAFSALDSSKLHTVARHEMRHWHDALADFIKELP